MRPAVRCGTSRPNATSVSKVFDVDDKEADAEYLLAKEIEKIDPGNIFTLKVLEICDVNPGNFNSRELAKCGNFDAFKPGSSRRILLPQLVMQNGGTSLEALLKDTYAIHGMRPGHHLLDQMWRLFEGLVIMERYRYIHQDIKTANIMYTYEKMVLVDLGLMTKDWDRHYETIPINYLRNHYEYFPPEYDVLAACMKSTSNAGYNASRTKISMGNMMAFIDNHMWARLSYGLPDARYTTIMREYRERLVRELREYEEHARRTILTLAPYAATGNSNANKRAAMRPAAQALSMHVNKIDTYGLGIALVDTLGALAIAKKIMPTRFKAYMEVAYGMLRPDPVKRFTPSEAKAAYLAAKGGTKTPTPGRGPKGSRTPSRSPQSRRFKRATPMAVYHGRNDRF